MLQGGKTNPTNSDEFIESVVKYISERKDLLEALESLLQESELIKSDETFNESTIKDVSELLMNNKDLLKGTMDIVKEHLEKDDNQLKMLLEQVNKVKSMEKELETLGNGLLAQGLISGAAVTTLTGALAGLLTVGGVTGALIVGGAAFVGFVALVAIAAIGYLIYQNRGEIKEGAIDAGKAVRGSYKDLIDKLPTIQARENNFDRLRSELLAGIADESKLKAGQSVENAKNQNKIVEMLQNKEQLMAIKELVKDGIIKNFSKDNMTRLLNKGLSTHLDDQGVLEELMGKFQPEIMAIGSDIKEVEQKVNEKAQGMKPVPQLDSPNSEQVNKEEKGVS